MKSHDAILIAVMAMAGCAAQNGPPWMSHSRVNESRSICDLVKQGLTDGLTARVEVVYKSDKVHYAYLLSRGCGVDGIIDVADMEPISEETLRDFYDSGDRRCVEADMPYICVMEAKIDADVKVVRVHTGKFAVEILKVYWFSFVDTEF